MSGRDVLEIAAHDPQDERQGDQLIDPDQADVGVGQAQLLEIQRQGQQHQQRRREAERQEREGDVFAEPELEAREGVGGGHAKNAARSRRSTVESSTLFQRFFMKAMSSVPAVETSLPVISAE